MSHHLPPHVSFGFVEAHAVVLDLDADRYFLLGREDTAVLTMLSRQNAKPLEPECLHKLTEKDFVRPGAGTPVRPVLAAPLRASALEASRNDGALSPLQVAALRFRVGLALRWCGLATTIQDVRRARDHFYSLGCRASPEEAAYKARGYFRGRVLVPTKRLCVPDSLALVLALWRHGIAADVYFGVRLEPFAAHAWVQQGDLLLSDTLNIVGEYTPVFRL